MFLENLKNFFIDTLFPIGEFDVTGWMVVVAAAVVLILLIIAITVPVCISKKKKKQALADNSDYNKSTSDEPVQKPIETVTVHATDDEDEKIVIEEEPIQTELFLEEALVSQVEEAQDNNEISNESENDMVVENEEPVIEEKEEEIIVESKVEEPIIEEPQINEKNDTEETEVVKETVKSEPKPAKAVNKETPAKQDKPVAKKISPKAPVIVGTDNLPKKFQRTSDVKMENNEPVESFGKFIITYKPESNPIRPYNFALVANNGQLLFESEPYKVKPRENSIAAFKRNVKEGTLIVDADKNGTYRFKLFSVKGSLIGVGETYKSRQACESSILSVKRFAETATLIEDQTIDDEQVTE